MRPKELDPYRDTELKTMRVSPEEIRHRLAVLVPTVHLERLLRGNENHVSGSEQGLSSRPADICDCFTKGTAVCVTVTRGDSQPGGRWPARLRVTFEERLLAHTRAAGPRRSGRRKINSSGSKRDELAPYF